MIFKTATLSPDLKLQQQAYYNLGNTLYRQGELKFEPDTDRPGRDGGNLATSGQEL